MGAESSVLEEYDLDEPSASSKSTWTLRQGRYNDELDVTVLSEQKENRQKWSLLQKNIKFLKSLRHPCIVKYLNTAIMSSELYLVIERSSPLPNLLETLDPLEITTGIHSVMEGLAFLHEQARISHNNVCLDSVYVTSNGTWKISELQHCCKFLEVTPDFLKNSRPFRNKESISPEEKAERLTITNEMGHTRDVFSFGVMAETLLEYISETGEKSKTFEILVQDKCLNADPKQRPNFSTLMKDQLFCNDLLLITKFLRELTLKPQREKEEFFSSLYPRLTMLAEEVVAKQLVQLLLCRFVLLEASAAMSIVPNILVPKRGTSEKVEVHSQRLSPLFSVPLYKTYVIPELIKMFYCHDYHIRMILLTYFPLYLDLFEKNDLEEVIFPQILLGVRDCHEDLASLSLHCLADLVKVLGRDTVIGGKSKVYFTQGTPKHLPKNAIETKSVEALDKVLLKDLASYSTLTTKTENSCNSVDEKRQERQNRLKEQRMAREQKRLEQQQKRKERGEKENEMPKMNIDLEGSQIQSSRNLPNPQINGHEEIQEPDHSSPGNKISDRKISYDFENQDVASYDVKVSKSWKDDRLDPDVYVTSDHSEDDWSDWDNSMENSPNAYSSVESVKRQDVGHSTFSTESSKKDDDLYSKSSPKNIQSKSMESDVTTKKSDTRNSVSSKSSKNALKLQSTKKKEPQKENKTLGAEFEIKSISTPPVKVSVETDYFADMGLTPVITKGTTSEHSIEKDGTTNKSSSAVKASPNLLTYTMDENSQLDSSGWGEDTGGWGDNDLNWAEED